MEHQQAKTSPEQMRLLAPEDDQKDDGKGDARVLQARDLIIFANGRFLDDELQPLDPARMAAMKDPVLAVPPSLSLGEAMAVKVRLDLAGLTVTTLNQQWLDAIKEHEK
jgi:hypothetical protein